jgi:hypothetical protein
MRKVTYSANLTSTTRLGSELLPMREGATSIPNYVTGFSYGGTNGGVGLTSRFILANH